MKGDMGEMSAKAEGDILEGVMPGDRPGVFRPGVIGPAPRFTVDQSMGYRDNTASPVLKLTCICDGWQS